MGNRAIITTPQREIGVYLHWNGGRDTVEPLLTYCKLQGYRSPDTDGYGFARICQVMGNFFGGSLSLGIEPYTTDENMCPGDNGIYVIENWTIKERLRDGKPFLPEWEQSEYDFDEMLHKFDNAMPEGERLPKGVWEQYESMKIENQQRFNECEQFANSSLFPNVYVDTKDCKLKLDWLGSYGEWPISAEVAEAIDKYTQEEG